MAQLNGSSRPSYLTAESSDSETTAYQKGYEAGEQQHLRSDNPYACKTSLQHQWWDAGWCQALDDLCGRG